MTEADSEFKMGTPYFCRGCLMEFAELKNMAENDLIEDFYKFADIEMNDEFGLPNLLCASCESSLMECRRFRDMCRQSDTFLKSNMKKSTTVKSDQSTQKQGNAVINLLYDENLIVTIIAPDTKAKIVLQCPYHCEGGFTKRPELLNHLMSSHNVSRDFSIDLQYCCPFENCAYHMNNSKRFTGRKFLNQHLQKVHSLDSRICNHCHIKFPTNSAYTKHLGSCSVAYECKACDRRFKTDDRLLVHLMRRHPLLHQQYKMERKVERETKRNNITTDMEYTCDSPKRSSSTQTLTGIKNDVTLPSWPETKTDEISTQTFGLTEEMYYQEIPLANTQTQTFPLEFGLARSNKETITSETQSPDLSIKETQTCCCLYESPKFATRLFDSVSSSPVLSLTSTETQTGLSNIDALLGFTSAETQTSFEETLDKESL